MLSEVQEKSQMVQADTVQTIIVPQAATVPANTQTATTTVIKTPTTMSRKTFAEQEPAIFAIWGVAIAYVAVLILNRAIKTKKVHH